MTLALKDKKILIGITGGIAAYKSAECVRLLRKQGACVRVVMTKGALEFITPTTLQALSGQPVFVAGQAIQDAAAMDHIALAKWPDLIVIAPASANFIARLARGLADDLLTTLCLATTRPIVIAPAMNKNMWQHQNTQANIKSLQAQGIVIKGPASGEQACGDVGFGRMLESDAIIAEIVAHFAKRSLTGVNVMVTAGPTHEPIDPVRYLSNRSAGKMGYALAQAFYELGANVTLISGPVVLNDPDGIVVVRVKTAQEMYNAVMERVNDSAIFVGAAAVCDYRPVKVAQTKMKKSLESLTLALEPTQDIIATVAAMCPAPFMVGFAAETEQVCEQARAKLEHKALDMIVANRVGEGIGFEVDQQSVTIISKGAKTVELPKAHKLVLAREIAQRVSGAVKTQLPRGD